MEKAKFPGLCFKCGGRIYVGDLIRLRPTDPPTAECAIHQAEENING